MGWVRREVLGGGILGFRGRERGGESEGGAEDFRASEGGLEIDL